jgi:dipeptidyl aminopeptidase/acylaminoacyl peptidase
LLIAHGEQDPLVPCHQSELLHEALKRAGVEVAFPKIPGAGHGGKGFSTDRMQAALGAFFHKHSQARPDGKARTPSPRR